ncbi:Uncharacterized protein APZ42_000250, partial [Daphnia magna]
KSAVAETQENGRCCLASSSPFVFLFTCLLTFVFFSLPALTRVVNQVLF